MTPLPVYRCSWRRDGQARPQPDDGEWAQAEWCPLRSWSGADDPEAAALGGSGFRLLADGDALHLCADLFSRPPHLDRARTAADRSPGLWDFDVVELFLSPSPRGLPYGELEGSPLGQALDYWIEKPRAVVDREWRSGMAVRGTIHAAGYVITLSAPWVAFGIAPQAGMRVRVNVCAALGLPDRRRYLSWSATGTARPDFHVPERFGWLEL